MTSAFQPRPRPLPLRVKPFPSETLASYTARIEAAHKLPKGLINEERRRSGLPTSEYLCLATGSTVPALKHALPELDTETAQHLRWSGPQDGSRGKQAFACKLCAAAKGITGRVVVWAAPHQMLCRRHHRWTGGTVFPVDEQPNVEHLPELARANQRHAKLAAQGTPEVIYEAFLDADDMVSHWDRNHQLPTCEKRLDQLLRQYPARATVWPPQLDRRAPAARYPETVAMTALLLDPHWVKCARSPAKRSRTHAINQVVQHVTGRYRPNGLGDPLAK